VYLWSKLESEKATCGGRKKEKTPSAKLEQRQILGRLPRNGEKI